MAELPAKILLLGSGELGRELTISLKRFGSYVVACDSYEGAPAMAMADESLVFDMSDAGALRAAIGYVTPDFIVPEVEKLAVNVLEQVVAGEVPGGENSRVIPNSAGVIATFDRRAIRRLAAEVAQVPTSTYAFAQSLEELVEAGKQIGFPCFIKPTMSSSGHGQSIAYSLDDFAASWEKASTGARAATNCVIVEGAVEFDYEITLLTVRYIDAQGQAQIQMCEPIGHRQVDGDYVESWQPQAMSAPALAHAREIATKVIEAIAQSGGEETTTGIFGVELFICGDKAIFSEVSPRPHDTGMVTSITQRQSEFDLHARAILGLPLDTSLETPGASAVIKSQIESDNPKYVGVQTALENAQEVRVFAKPHAHVGRRMGVVLASGPVDEARESARRAAGAVSVVDG